MENLVPALDKLVNQDLPEKSAQMTKKIKTTFDNQCSGIIRALTTKMIHPVVKLGTHALFWKATELAAEWIQQQCAEAEQGLDDTGLCDYAPTNIVQKQHVLYGAPMSITATQYYFAVMKWREKRGNHQQNVERNVKTLEKVLGDTQKILDPIKKYFWDDEFSRIYHKGRNEFFGNVLQRVVDQRINARLNGSSSQTSAQVPDAEGAPFENVNEPEPELTST